MSDAIRHLAFALYAACVDFMLNLASLLGVTYRDSNALVLLVAFPLTTLVLLLVCTWQRVMLWKASAAEGRSESRGSSAPS